MLPVTTLTINCSSVALIWFGGLRIDSGQMQVGSLIAFLVYFAQILMAVMMATMTLMVLPRASVCAERINEVLSLDAGGQQPGQSGAAGYGMRGVVRLDGATFRYPGADRAVLQDISLTALPGTTTAIVGSTGSGKSTLVSLICRLYDVTSGAVLVDGVDVRDHDIERTLVGHRAGAAARLPVLRDRRRQPAYRRGRTQPTTRCGTRCGSRLPTSSCAHTTTGCRCGSPRAVSISPAGSGSGWRSRAR